MTGDPHPAGDAHPPGDADFSLRRIAVPAFGPTILSSTGLGALLPVLATSARDLGASVALAAVAVAVSGVTELLGTLPAGAFIARVGERRALIAAAAVEVVAAGLALTATHVAQLFLALAIMGPASGAFHLARQSWLTDKAPFHMRARAMSTLGGTHRIGLFIGPFIAAPVIGLWGPRAAYGIVLVCSLLAGLLAWRTVDPTGATPGDPGGDSGEGMLRTLVHHRRVLATLGTGVLAIGVGRASRIALLPLWAEAVGLTPAQTALIFGVAGGVELALVYPAGSIMDRFGRVWVAVPCALVLGLGILVLPFTSGLIGVGLAAVLMGIGNGLGSGIVMTLGADLSPAVGRARFLAVWRILPLVGLNGGPLLIGAVVAAGSLSAACLSVGTVVVLGAGWMWHWLPRMLPDGGGSAPSAPA